MERITNGTNFHGNHGLATILDSSLASEFGWGRHTLESAVLTIGERVIHVCVCCSDTGIAFVTIADPSEHANSFMRGSKKKEEKFFIAYENIVDVYGEPSLKELNTLYSDPDVEVRRQTTKIYLRPRSNNPRHGVNKNRYFFHEDFCIVDTHETTQFLRHVMAAWHSNIMRKSLRQGRLVAHADAKLAQDYYDETCHCFTEVTDFAELSNICSDFGKEVLLDLALKDCVFRSRELFALSIGLLEQLITSPSGAFAGENLASFTSSSSSAATSSSSSTGLPNDISSSHQSMGFSNISSSDRISRDASPFTPLRGVSAASPSLVDGLDRGDDSGNDTDFLSRLQNIALQRLRLMRSILQMLACILYNSEVVVSRFGLLSGPSPFTQDSLCDLLVKNFYQSLCYRLGISGSLDDHDILKELQNTILITKNDPMGGLGLGGVGSGWMNYSESTARLLAINYDAPQDLSTSDFLIGGGGGGGRMSASPSLESLSMSRSSSNSSLKANTNIADSVLGPMKDKARARKENFSKGRHAAELNSLARKVSDLQYYVLMEIGRISFIGSPRNNTGRFNTALPLRPLFRIPMGTSYARCDNWEDSLESLVLRIAEILHDILETHSVCDHFIPAYNKQAVIAERDARRIARSSGAFAVGISNDGTSTPSKLTYSLRPDEEEEELDDAITLPPSPSRKLRGGNDSIPMRRSTLWDGDFHELAEASTQQVNKLGLNKPGKPGKQPVKTFWSKNNRSEGASHLPARSWPLETQELMLFASTTLLSVLATDCPRIREALLDDLSQHFGTIMTVFNIICPRPKKANNFAVTSSSSNNSTTDLVGENVASAANTNASSSNNNSTSTLSRFAKAFGFGNAASGVSTRSAEGPSDVEGGNVTGSAVSPAKPSIEQRVNGLVVRPTVFDISKLSSSEYGPPRFGMSDSTWLLVIQSRRMIEELLCALGLAFVGEQMEPQKDFIAQLATKSVSDKVEPVRETIHGVLSQQANGTANALYMGRGGDLKVGEGRRRYDDVDNDDNDEEADVLLGQLRVGRRIDFSAADVPVEENNVNPPLKPVKPLRKIGVTRK